MLDSLRRIVIVTALLLLGAGQACACVVHSPVAPSHAVVAAHDSDHHHDHQAPAEPDADCCDCKTVAVQSAQYTALKADRAAEPAPAPAVFLSAVLTDRWTRAPTVSPPRLRAPRPPTPLDLKTRLQN